jgi:hypothetical protein
MDDLNVVLARSHEFAEHLTAEIETAATVVGGERAEAASAAAELAFEHGHALRVLFQAETPNSATSLLRHQYEALLRAAWLLYAASEAQITKVSAPLTRETAAAAKNIPGALEMLAALEKKLESAPQLRGLVAPLREMRDEGWAPMNAFVHGGFHALSRSGDGFPRKLAVDVVKLSNGLLHLTGRLLAVLTGSVQVISRVDDAFKGFEDVLPTISAAAAPT